MHFLNGSTKTTATRAALAFMLSSLGLLNQVVFLCFVVCTVVCLILPACHCFYLCSREHFVDDHGRQIRSINDISEGNL